MRVVEGLVSLNPGISTFLNKDVRQFILRGIARGWNAPYRRYFAGAGFKCRQVLQVR
jgi:hypothetical protein